MKSSSLLKATNIVAQSKDAVDPVDRKDLRKLLTQTSLCDLARCPDVEVSTEQNSVDMLIKQPDGILNVNIRWYDKVAGATLYFAKREKPLYLLTPDIIELRGEGKTQKQVARILGMSQPYVSVLERKHKQRQNAA